jgi:5'-3' exonuclease
MIIVDCDFLCNVAKHAMGGTELTTEGARTDILFNVFLQIRRILREFVGHQQLAFVWDCPPLLRTQMFSGYKKHRREKREALSQEEKERDELSRMQFAELYDVLHEIGFRKLFKIPGYEGDDLIASLINSNMSDDNEFIIASNDKDMFQLLRDNVKIYNVQTRKLLTKEGFQSEYLIDPCQWGEVLAIAGCTTDEVPGVHRVGVKTAIQYLKGNLSPRSKIYRSIKSEENQEIIERNRELVVLPFKSTPVLPLNGHNRERYRDRVTIGNLDYTFSQLSFHSMRKAEALIEWAQLLVPEFYKGGYV